MPEEINAVNRISVFLTKSVQPASLNDLLQRLVKRIRIPSVFLNDFEQGACEWCGARLIYILMFKCI